MSYTFASRTRLLGVLAAFGALAALSAAAFAGSAAAHSGGSFLSRFHKISSLGSTVPKAGTAAGDQNPYGTAVVPRTMGKLTRGDVLVSNFNDAANAQGTGSSIVEISPAGKRKTFAVVPQPTPTPAVGLTTALVALRSGDVIVGSLPAPGGMSSAARAGALTVLNSKGHVVKTIKGHAINGPWDMTAVDHGKHVVLFVTNVLNGTVAAGGMPVKRGTVVRLALKILPGHAPKLTSARVIATGFTEHTDPNALVVGPTGDALGANGTLYVADTANSRIAAVPNALTRMTTLKHAGKTVTHGGKLNSPLGLTIAPNGDILTVNGADGRIVETTPAGKQRGAKTLVANGAGDLFGLAVAPHGHGLYFVDDIGSGPNANSLQLLH